jgi:hypothetical protein
LRSRDPFNQQATAQRSDIDLEQFTEKQSSALIAFCFVELFLTHVMQPGGAVCLFKVATRN